MNAPYTNYKPRTSSSPFCSRHRKDTFVNCTVRNTRVYAHVAQTYIIFGVLEGHCLFNSIMILLLFTKTPKFRYEIQLQQALSGNDHSNRTYAINTNSVSLIRLDINHIHAKSDTNTALQSDS
jgi:hypothetical protein